MSELVTQILKAKSKERELKTSIRKISAEIEDLSEVIEYDEKTLQDKVDTAKLEYEEEQSEEIKTRYEPKVETLEEEIEKLKTLLDSKDVDDTEELVQAKETKEYLNTAAIVVNKYYEELKKVSSTYFIDLAYVKKSLSLKDFRKEFEGIPRKIQELSDMQEVVVQPFVLTNWATEKHNSNIGIYVTAAVANLWILLTTPIALHKAINRAKYLHKEAQRYHKLMHALAKLKLKTDEEIAKIFSSLLQLKSQRLKEELKRKTDELDSLMFDLKDELDAVSFDEEGFVRKQNMGIMANRTKLESLKGQLEKLESQLSELEDLLERLTGERYDFLEVERENYLKAREEREVVLPTHLLYDWNQDSNSFFPIQHGLYLYNDRDIVSNFIQMLMFQLRNIMDWGTIQFKILDLLGAEFVAPLMLPITGKAKVQDIVVSTLREEREQVVELMHDLLVRRKTQILSTVSSLGDYNLLQKSSGSAPMPYQIIFIILTDALKMDEKLIQLIHNGEKLGLLVFIFMKDEFLTVQLSKSIEDYFNSFTELSDSGLSSYEPQQYTELLEQKEADRKSHM